MAVKIRLSRIGKKNRPYNKIVAVDSRKKRDGICLEDCGTFDPIEGKVIQLHQDRIEAWIKVGAICSPAVEKILKATKKSSVKQA